MLPDSAPRGTCPVRICTPSSVAPRRTRVRDTRPVADMNQPPSPASAPTREWTLRRNCSLAPRQVARAYAALCAGSLVVAAGFLAHGVWLVLAFSLVELALVGLALLIHARHATDHERIALSPSGLLVTRVRAQRREFVRLDPLWARVLGPDPHRRALICLESRGVRVEIGRFVDDTRRRQVAGELRLALRALSAMR